MMSRGGGTPRHSVNRRYRYCCGFTWQRNGSSFVSTVRMGGFILFLFCISNMHLGVWAYGNV